MGEIRKDNLHESLIEELNELGNIDLSGKQDKTDESLLTESKDVIGSINELKNDIDNLVIMFNEMKQIVDERLSIIACTGITLDRSSLSFSSINATSTLIATIQPNDCTEEVIWSTSNSSVATVDSNGVVTSKGSGSCTINVVCGSYTAKCNVSVVLQIPCQSLWLSPPTLEFSKTGVSNRVVANVSPSNCTDKVVWESLSTGVCRVDQYGNVTAVAAGEGEIKATCGSKTAKCTVYVYDIMEI
jgi:uncharacterized protein YjdB